ncbi:MAG: DHHW family protein [Oscillospiraceae bacterium]
MNKGRSIAIVAVTLTMLFGLAVWGLAAPDAAVSRAERRKLAQAPELTAQSVFSGDYMTGLETYLLDQFPMRDTWRSIKARMRFGLFRQLDNNGIYLAGDQVCKLEYPLKEEQVAYGAGKINSLLDTYLQDTNVWYAIIPDKNCYAAPACGMPHMDYDRLVQLMRENLGSRAEYVDLFELLRLEDYYRTDAHWRQDHILPAAQALADAMELGVDLTAPAGGFRPRTLSPFYGVYFGQSALNVEPDTLTYLTSDAIDAATMTGAEFEGVWPVYTTEKFEGMDGYDVFAGGAQAILTMKSPRAQTDRELIIFRDSFGSSIAPLFLEGYARVTLIDLRYVSASLLEQFVDFADQDVLFLYSTSLLNSAMLLR